jgi:hypothetical protein
MNCHAIQNKILTLPDPRVIPDVLRDHVAGCAVCRVWAKEAARLEALLENLPVPPAPRNKKAEMIDDLTSSNPVITRPLAFPARKPGPLERFLAENKVVIGGLAAAILVVIGGWLMLRDRGNNPGPVVAQQSPTDPFLEKMVRWDVALAKAASPRERLDILGGMADGLSGQTRSLARVATGDELRDLARWYDKVVKDGMVRQAEKIPAETLNPTEREERKKQLTALAEQLGVTANQAEKMTDVPEDTKPALQKIAKSAKEAEEKLRKLAG